MKKINLKKRRGLHTIIGAVFFVLVMGSTISYVTYSMGLVDNLAYQIDAKQDNNLNRQSEKFEIVDVDIVGNEFNVTLKNTGTLPINVTKIWAKNMTDPLWNQTSYQINQIVSPGGKLSNIGIGTGLVALDSESYSLKMLTSRGNALETQVISSSNQALDMNLYMTPASPVSESDITLLYTVRNNLTEGIIQTLTPIIAPPVVTGTATASLVSGPIPASYSGLQPGQMAFFEWTYNVEGNDGDLITFNATLANAVSGNNATDTGSILVPPVSTTSINEVLGGSVGIISMNFTSFEVCEPSASDCTSDSTDWSRAWLIDKSTDYIWRMNVTNNGVEDIIIDEFSALLVLRAQSGGGGGIAKAHFVMKDSTLTVENGGAYTQDFKILPAGGVSTIIYFGADGAGGSSLETTHGDVAIYGANMLLFGYEDLDNSGTETAGDTPYSQNLPFQALRME